VIFFDYDATKNQEIVQLLQTDNAYQEYATEIEKLLRLKFSYLV
jgi:hypothetical protein